MDPPAPGEGAAERDTWDDWMESALDSFASEADETAEAAPAVAQAASSTASGIDAVPSPPVVAAPARPDRPAPVTTEVDWQPGDAPARQVVPADRNAPGGAASPRHATPAMPGAHGNSAFADETDLPSAVPPRRRHIVSDAEERPAFAAPPTPLAAPEARAPLEARETPRPRALVQDPAAAAPTTVPAPLIPTVPDVPAPPQPDADARELSRADRPVLPLPDLPAADWTDSDPDHWWPEASAAGAGSRPPLRDERGSTPAGRMSRVTTGLTRSAAGWPTRGKRLVQWVPRFDFSPTHLVVAALILLGAAEIVVIGWHLLAGGPSGPSGLVTVTSRPPGVQVLIDGEPQGVTPASIRVSEGLHTLELRSAGPAQVMALQVDKDAEIARFFDLPVGTAAAALNVDAGAPGARVLVDGRPRGRSPLTIADLNPGPHIVRVERGPHWLEQGVTLESGASAVVSLPLNVPRGGPSGGHGWLTLTPPMELTVTEKGEVVGTTRAGPLQLPAGRHELEFVNELLGVRLTRAVEVSDGRTTSLDLALPPGMLSISAAPGGQVTIDGEPAGAAPVKLPLSPGQHDIIVRHGQLGERRLIVTLPAGATLAVAVDFRR